MPQVIITTAVKSLFISRVSLIFLGCLTLWIDAAGAEHTLISKDEFATQARNGIQASKMPLDPQFFNYHSRPLAPNIVSTRPVDIEFPPGEKNRLFVVEHIGRIQVINDLNGDPEASTFLDITDRTYHEREAGLNGMAFHPDFAENGFFFVFYNYKDASTGLKYNRLSRFQVDPVNPSQALKESETPLFTQHDEHSDHNAGDMFFGPDGYLYLALGDEGGGYDQYRNAQRIDKDLFAGILRLDVDENPENLLPNPHPSVHGNYRIPKDNPFVNLKLYNDRFLVPEKVRTEIYAIGLRNPWRMHRDEESGVFYITDTGDHTREEINIVTPGANFGYPLFEGSVLGPRYNKAYEKFRNRLTFPIAEYGKELGLDIAGLFLYRGEHIPSLNGKLIFSDFHSSFLGRIDVNDKGVPTGPIEWFYSHTYVSTFGTHPATGELLMADYFRNSIVVLKEGPDPDYTPIPEKLSSTGLFEDLQTLTPTPGLMPYDVNVTFWSDNAKKRRWFGLPDSHSAFNFKTNGKWHIPTGTVHVKHFDILMDESDPESIRRLETRVFTKTPSDGLYGVTYRWNEEQNDATLVPPEGAEEILNIKTAEGRTRFQKWSYPGRRECLSCHNYHSTRLLAFKTSQLNKVIKTTSGDLINQLELWQQAGLFSNPVPSTGSLPALAAPDDERFSIEYRVRSYLDANCAQCHHPSGVSSLKWDARAFVSRDDLNIINVSPYNNYADPKNLFIHAGSPEHSVILERISKLSVGRMPPLGSHVVDEVSKQLLTTWIETGLKDFETFDNWRIRHFSSLNNPDSVSGADPDEDGMGNYGEFLLGRNPLISESPSHLEIAHNGNGSKTISFNRSANLRFQVEWTDDPTEISDWRHLDEPENSFSIPAAGGPYKVFDRSTSAEKRFYRIKIHDR